MVKRLGAKKVLEIVGGAIFIGMIILFLYSIFGYSSLKGFLFDKITLYGLPALFLLSFFIEVFPQYFSAHMIVIIAALLEMNLFLATLFIVLATLLASIIGFWIGKNIEENLLRNLFGKTVYKKVDRGMNKYGKWYVAVSAISPFPYVPIIFGALDMDWKKFLIYGMIPRTIGFIITGIFAYYALPTILKFAGL